MFEVFCSVLYFNQNVYIWILEIQIFPVCNVICVVIAQDPAGIFDLIEVVGNGTYGQVYKVSIDSSF